MVAQAGRLRNFVRGQFEDVSCSSREFEASRTFETKTAHQSVRGRYRYSGFAQDAEFELCSLSDKANVAIPQMTELLAGLRFG